MYPPIRSDNDADTRVAQKMLFAFEPATSSLMVVAGGLVSL
jgi:hypothetical protein